MENREIKRIAVAFANSDRDLKLPVKVSWKRRVNRKRIADACQIIDEALRDLANRYADEEHSYMDENKRRRVKEEFMKEYIAAVEEIMAQEQDVNIDTVKLEDMGDIEITDSDMDTLEFMIID